MQPYRQRKPRDSPLWQCLTRHFHAFLAAYEALFQPRYGFLRPIIPEVVGKFMDCGDLDHGFARVRCDHCTHEYLLAFSCKGRWFCPSCHQKKVLDFHPHLHALVADGLFTRDGLFHVMPKADLQPLEELFRARVITFLVGKGLLPPERARILRGWTHSGFNVFRSRRVAPEERADLERLAQYIIRNPFSVEKMQVTDANPANPDGSIIYHSGMNPKIQRNFEVFTPCEFIAAITQHIPDKSFQLVRYYGWYSNKMRGQRSKQAVAATQTAGKADAVIDVSEHKPRRIPSAKWRELIKKVWEADPLLCPRCRKEMRIVALIDEREVIERILRHLGLWEQGVRVDSGPDPPGELVVEPYFDDAFSNYDTEPDLACANE